MKRREEIKAFFEGENYKISGPYRRASRAEKIKICSGQEEQTRNFSLHPTHFGDRRKKKKNGGEEKKRREGAAFKKRVWWGATGIRVPAMGKNNLGKT